jgi:hypothetical protein
MIITTLLLPLGHIPFTSGPDLGPDGLEQAPNCTLLYLDSDNSTRWCFYARTAT